MSRPRLRSLITDGDVVRLENLLRDADERARLALAREDAGRPFASWAGFVLTHGLRWAQGSPLPPGVAPGVGGQCYRDSMHLAMSRGFTYVEGYAMHGGKAVSHAWCADRAGNVVDPTWRVSTACGYIGVPLQLDAVVAVARSSKRTGVFGRPQAAGLLDGRIRPGDFVAGVYEGYVLAWGRERSGKGRG